MRVAVIGRTGPLLEAARAVVARGHEVPVVWTCRAEAFYGTGQEDFRAFAQEVGADFVDDVAINSDANRARLAAHACDIAISINWLTVLRQETLDLFPLGVLNAHGGDLPRFRGNACANWAILTGEPHSGLCVHLMLPQLDAGSVVLRDRFPLTDDSYIGEVVAWVARRAPEMLADAVDALGSGTAVLEPQPTDPALALRCYPRRPEDSRIDWSWSVDRVLRMIRASSRPHTGAFGFLEGGRKVTLWRAVAVAHAGAFLAVPGQVCYGTDGDPVIACADGVIRLTELEMEGAGSQAEAKGAILKSLRNRLT